MFLLGNLAFLCKRKDRYYAFCPLRSFAFGLSLVQLHRLHFTPPFFIFSLDTRLRALHFTQIYIFVNILFASASGSFFAIIHPFSCKKRSGSTPTRGKQSFPESPSFRHGKNRGSCKPNLQLLLYFLAQIYLKD